MRLLPIGAALLGLVSHTAARADDVLPRYMTDAEREVWDRYPPAVERGPGPTPVGDVHCVAEYEPMEGLIVSWEGGASITGLLAQMASHITTTGAALLYVAVDNTTVRNSATTSLSSQGVDLNRVRFVTQTMDSVWMRDYGPRYVYEGSCRAIIDHVYNRPRPNDDAFPATFASLKRHARYALPLIHGGGNYHLDALGGGYCTRLVVNENPSLTEPQIDALWLGYQNLDTTFFTPFPTSVDLTQHIDMWMQVIGDRAVVISDWPSDAGSTQDQICDAAAATLAARGFAVHRVPARLVGGVHYTYTNAVLCNDLVLVPSYTHSQVSPNNAPALAAWNAALPGKTVVQLNCQSIVSLAGVMHCIVMHVPIPMGGESPTAHLRTLRGGETLLTGQHATIQWISDDDLAVTSVDLLLSTDGGATYPTAIALNTADDGSHFWTVPEMYSTTARVRVLVRDAEGNTGAADSPANFTINGPPPTCTGDIDRSGAVELSDLARLLAAFGACASDAAYEPDADLDASGCVLLNDLALLLAAFGSVCP